MKIAIILNSKKNLIQFRLELIDYLKKYHEIYVICPNDYNYDTPKNINFINLNIKRKSTNPFREIHIFFKLYKIIRSVEPDFIMSFTIKPNIYGSLISRVLKIKNINTITGLGNTFINKNIFNNIIFFIYKKSIQKSYYNFFHNDYDLKLFINKKNIQNYKVVNGSGINLEKLKHYPYPKSHKVNYLFIGRIIKEKGIIEFCNAAKSIYKKKLNTSFVIIGEIEDHKIFNNIKSLIDNKIIKYHGYKKNIHDYIKDAHAVILPSYREGLSHSLLTALAHGRPIIATDVPGCREVVQNNFNGYLCETKNYKNLEEKIIKFYSLNNEEKKIMGENSRISSYKFDINKINYFYQRHLINND